MEHKNINIESTGNGYRVRLVSEKEQEVIDATAWGVVVIGLVVVGYIVKQFYT